MAYEEALEVVNGIQSGLAGLARSVVTALKDGKVSPLEGMTLAMKGMTFASALILAIQNANKNEVLYVLEHGHWELTEPGFVPSEG